MQKNVSAILKTKHRMRNSLLKIGRKALDLFCLQGKMFLDIKDYKKDCKAISIANVSRETRQRQVPDKTLAGR